MSLLGRPRLRAKFPSLTDHLVSEFLDVVRSFATLVDDVPREFVLERDPKDEPYLNLASTSGAEHLVTRDRDLLDLPASDSVGLALRRQFPRLQIVEPANWVT